MLYHNGSIFRRLFLLWKTVLSAVSGYLKTVSGSIVSVTDALAKPAVDVSVAIEPVQSGSGDPSPDNVRPITGWTAASVCSFKQNLFDISTLTQASSWTYVDGSYLGTSQNLYRRFGLGLGNNFLLQIPKGYDGQICVNAYYSQSTSGNGFAIQFEYADGTNDIKQGSSHGTDYDWKTFISTSGKTVSGIRFTYGQSKDLAVQKLGIFLYGSDDPEAYDYTYAGNAIPVFFSKNLATGFLRGYWAFADGAFAQDTKWICTDKIPCKPNTDYVTSWSNGYTTRWQGFVWFDANGNYISTANSQSSATNGKTFRSPANAAYMAYNIGGTSSSTDISPSDIQSFQLEEGTTATAYEAPGTVYGGTLDLTTGLLTVAHANIASYNGESINEPWLSSMDKFVAGATPTTGAQVVYPLTTPLTYQLTGQELTLLAGDNNVWANTGDTTLTYYGSQPEEVDALNLLLGGGYRNLHGPDDVSDREALDIILNGGSDR